MEEALTVPLFLRRYQPKGGMCMTCARRHDDCHGLGFENMPVIRTEDGINIVRCTQHVRSNAELGEEG